MTEDEIENYKEVSGKYPYIIITIIIIRYVKIIVTVIIIAVIIIINREKAFLEYDVDGSGNISIAELGSVMKKLGENPTEDELQVKTLSSLFFFLLEFAQSFETSIGIEELLFFISYSKPAFEMFRT